MSRNAELGRLVGHWGVDAAAIDGLDGLLDGMRATYARVEALAAEHVAAAPATMTWDLEKIAGADPHHAWMFRATDRAPAPASGPLAGLRLAVKDSIAVADVPMTAGSAFLREGFLPRRSAVAVERALDAGATLAGTAVCEDLCYSGSSFTSATGPVLNPYDPERAAGGSTSGCDVLLATEFSMDHLGLMARRAGDLARLLDAVAGPCAEDPRQAGIGALRGSAADIGGDISGLRIGIVRDGFGWPDRSDPRVDAVVRAAADALARLCAGAEEISIGLHRHGRDIHVPISCEGGLATVFEQNSQGSNHAGAYDPDLARAFGEALATNIDALPLNGAVSLIAGTVLRRETKSRVMALAQALRVKLRAQYDAALRRFDLLVMPTVPMPPHRLPKGPLAPAAHQKLAF